MAASPGARRPRLLKAKYGGYHHHAVPREDAELTHVGPATPCGEYLRRFWQPVAFTHELQGPAAAPAHPRRGPGPLPRRRRADGAAEAALQPPRHLAGVRRHLRARHPLLLPRLAVRRGRHDPGDARASRRGARSRIASTTGPTRPRVPGPDLRLHGPPGEAPASSRLRRLRARRTSAWCPAASTCCPATGCRSKRTAWTPSTGVPAHEAQRPAVQRGLCSPGPDSNGRRRHRQHVRRYSPRRGQRLGPHHRANPPEHQPVSAAWTRMERRRRSRDLADPDQLGGAHRRHAHAAARLSPGPRRRSARLVGDVHARGAIWPRSVRMGAPTPAGRLRGAGGTAPDRDPRAGAPGSDRPGCDHVQQGHPRGHSRRAPRARSQRHRSRSRPDHPYLHATDRPARAASRRPGCRW